MLNFSKVKDKTIVGFNTGHHGGCAIMHKGKMVAISEERVNRKKYSEGYLDSFFYCLDALKIGVKDIDLFVSSSYHKRLPKNFSGYFGYMNIPKKKFITVDHHLSHAYSAYFLSSFDRALVVVIDGLGNDSDTESYYIAKNSTIKRVGGNKKDRSMYKGIGRAYEAFTNFCGWSAQEAGKTMGLSAYGKEKYPDLQLFDIDDKLQAGSRLEGKYHHASLDFIKRNKISFGKPFSGFDNKDAAYFVQDRLEKVILDIINKLYDEYKIENLCLAGGVFLNSIVNRKILEKTKIKKIFVLPCCDDTGQPLGNLLYGYHGHLGYPKQFLMKTPYLGKEYTEKDYLDVIEKKQERFILPYKVKSTEIGYKKYRNIENITAKLLSEGKIIGWFQGSSEIGPRALGHRSILCAPYPKKMKDMLNAKIKHREMFRPFAPVVLKEKLPEYFDLAVESPFMLKIAKIKKGKVNKIPATSHIDKTARVQTVTKKMNDKFYDLIKSFYRITKVPVILNTSFNDAGEPIVETPKDAMIMFCITPMDYLVLGDYLIWKK